MSNQRQEIKSTMVLPTLGGKVGVRVQDTMRGDIRPSIKHDVWSLSKDSWEEI